MRFVFPLLLLGVALIVSPAVAQDSDMMTPEEAWKEHVTRVLVINEGLAGEAAAPLARPMLVCHDTDCEGLTQVSLSDEEQRRIAALFAVSPATPDEERQLVARAVALIETFVGSRNGTANDHPGNEHLDGEPGQLDCVSEATNTTTYLSRLEAAGLLRHHRIGGFVERYLLILQHVAMELIETATGDAYVVDSWVGANGEEPAIEAYIDWRLRLEV